MPEQLVELLKIGQRVEVQFGRTKIYTGIVLAVGPKSEIPYQPKSIISIIDEKPILKIQHLDFWKWIASYYFCSLGEVMHAALPAGMKLSSETQVMLKDSFQGEFENLTDLEYLIAEALTVQHQLSLDDIRGIIQRKTIYPVINSLLEKGILFVEEEMRQTYKPKIQDFIELKTPFDSDLNLAFELTTRSEKQTNALLALYQLINEKKKVTKQEWYKISGITSSVKNALVKKDIIEVVSETVSRLITKEPDIIDLPPLTSEQVDGLKVIRKEFEQNKPILLHGVTGSGKTRIYIELAKDCIKEGKQVLILLPEIALTTHLINRLKKVFGNKIVVFHSKLNNAERVEVWNSAINGQPILLGARSSLFLPFADLDLIVVDEEHDRSYKQDNPAPRYNARDAALVLAQKCNANIILGSATPSFESFYNVDLGKYVKVEMKHRVGNTPLPKFHLIDLKDARKRRLIHEEFSTQLLERIKKNLDIGKQVILFQNRRGFSPFLKCNTCGWHATCIHCDVSQTFHKYFHKMVCHYCNYQILPPKRCPDCGSDTLDLRGFGTEKIEEVLKPIFPHAKIARMDLDTVRTRKSQENIIEAFEEKRINILIGTQMITKGLDFDSVGLVGVVNADMIVNFPDFRAHERAYQLITQVAGRAGRKQDEGSVVIQTTNTDHPVIMDVLVQNFNNFYKREIAERQRYFYPPFFRLILIIVKHKKPEVCQKGAIQLASLLRDQYGRRIKGPTVPVISKIRNQYIRHIMIKLEKDASIMSSLKFHIGLYISQVKSGEGLSTVRYNVNVDPY